MALKAFTLVSTILVLISMGWFMLASLPLLVLKHDTPKDAAFIRNLFNLYYRLLAGAATVATVSYALWGNYMFSAGMALLALLALFVRRWMMATMDAVRAEMAPHDRPRIARFRKLHIGGMALNAAQLGVTVLSLRALTL